MSKSDTDTKVVKLDAGSLNLMPSTTKTAPQPAAKSAKRKASKKKAKQGKTTGARGKPERFSTDKLGETNNPPEPPPSCKLDLSTTDGLLERMQEIAAVSRDADALRAIKELLAHYSQQKDPDAKLDPAEVCAYLARCQLYGDDPGAVLIKKHGLRKVAKALLDSLGLDSVTLVMGKDSACAEAAVSEEEGE